MEKSFITSGPDVCFMDEQGGKFWSDCQGRESHNYTITKADIC